MTHTDALIFIIQDFRLCNYPFVFDAKAKTYLLEADQNVQMHTAMQEATSRGLIFGIPYRPIQQYLVLEVRRDNLVNDTINELTKCASSDLKKPLKVCCYLIVILYLYI